MCDFKTVISISISQPSGTIAVPKPPPSPVHRRTPMQRTITQDEDEDVVAQTTDSTVIIRVTPRQHGEEILSVEMAAEEVETAEQTEQEEEEEKKAG